MIKITDTMGIRASKRSYTICFRKIYIDEKTGAEKEKWEPEFFFTEPEHLFIKMIKLAVAEGINDGTWYNVLCRVEDAKATIMRTILPVLTPPERSS